MALWQFELNLIPKRAVVAPDGSVPHHLPEVVRDSMPGWDDSKFRVQAQASIERYLQKGSDYSEKYPFWGKEDLSCIHFFYDGGLQTGVWIRLDLRNFDFDLINLILDLSVLMQALGLNDRGELFEVTKDTLKNQIVKSHAFSFVKDPLGFIRQIAAQHGKS